MSANVEQFVEHLSAHQGRLMAYIFSLVPRLQDAQDIFQQTSLVLWRKYDQFDPGRDFLAWACGVAFYEVRNYLRSVARDRHCFNDDLLRTLADQRLAGNPRRERRQSALEQCVDKLRTTDRELVEKAYSGRQSLTEVAQEMDRAVQTVYNRLNLIRRKLVECVDRSIGEQGAHA
jgi:RNA polymerase sigma-70 factor (ECF subfamily)